MIPFSGPGRTSKSGLCFNTIRTMNRLTLYRRTPARAMLALGYAHAGFGDNNLGVTSCTCQNLIDFVQRCGIDGAALRAFEGVARLIARLFFVHAESSGSTDSKSCNIKSELLLRKVPSVVLLIASKNW